MRRSQKLHSSQAFQKIWLFSASFGNSWILCNLIEAESRTHPFMMASCTPWLSYMLCPDVGMCTSNMMRHLDIDERIIILEQRPVTWNTQEEWHAGFEIIVSTPLHLLREAGFTFSFLGEQPLMELHARNLSRFDPALLYQETRTANSYSLEAFIGTLDFDRLKLRTWTHGIMDLPPSIAACLQYSADWDSDAEN